MTVQHNNEPRRSDSELAEALRGRISVAVDWSESNDMVKLCHAAADRLSEYAALEATLPTVPCPTCGGTGMTPTGGYTWEGQPYFSSPECPDCDHGTVRLTLAQFVEACKPLFDHVPEGITLAEWVQRLVAADRK